MRLFLECESQPINSRSCSSERKMQARPAGLGLPIREPSVVSCVPLAPRITCSLLTVIATKHSFDFGNREWLVDRKSTRLNSSHVAISYAVFCLKKKKNKK